MITYGGDEKTKFRTRLEKGSQANSTEIFISHRNREGLIQNAMEAIDRARQGTYDPSTVYQFPNINQMMSQKKRPYLEIQN